jgi:hypothetical protein
MVAEPRHTPHLSMRLQPPASVSLPMTYFTASTSSLRTLDLRRLVTASLLALVAAAIPSAGCTSATTQCADVCAAGNKCPDSTIALDCSTLCSSIINNANEIGCSSQFDDLLSCEDGANVCADTSPCPAQETAFNTCVDAFCAAHPTESACGASSGSSSGGTGGAGG